MPNDDLISRKALIELLSTIHMDDVFPNWWVLTSEAKQLIGKLGERFEREILYIPAVDAEPVIHAKWKHIKKHLWHKDEKGEIDMYYLDFGFHNGPGCEICGECICANCEPDWAEKECRIGYYVCSECEQPTKTGESNYCPNCGAKLENPK